MSDNWLQFVPANPTFQPSPEAAESARAILTSLVPEAEDVTVSFKDSVEFFDPGRNWSGVECSACGADAEPWWQEAMAAAFDNGFADLSVVAKCCGAPLSLNELRYVSPAAFGSFLLEAMNPNVHDLSATQEQQLSAALGCNLTKIWVHI